MRKRSLETLSHTALSVGHLLGHRVDAAFVFNAANAPLLPVLRARPHPGRHARRRAGVEARQVGRRRSPVLPRRRVGGGAVVGRTDRGRTGDRRLLHGRVRRRRRGRSPTARRSSSRSGTTSSPRSACRSGAYHLVVARFEPENHVDVIVDGYVASGATLPARRGRRGAVRARSTRTGSSAVAAGDPRVRLVGSVWDAELLDQLYAHALTYVHGHSVGGTNPSLLRAIGAGTATIAFDVSFNRDVLGDLGRYFTDAGRRRARDRGRRARASRGGRGRHAPAGACALVRLGRRRAAATRRSPATSSPGTCPAAARSSSPDPDAAPRLRHRRGASSRDRANGTSTGPTRRVLPRDGAAARLGAEGRRPWRTRVLPVRQPAAGQVPRRVGLPPGHLPERRHGPERARHLHRDRAARLHGARCPARRPRRRRSSCSATRWTPPTARWPGSPARGARRGSGSTTSSTRRRSCACRWRCWSGLYRFETVAVAVARRAPRAHRGVVRPLLHDDPDRAAAARSRHCERGRHERTASVAPVGSCGTDRLRAALPGVCADGSPDGVLRGLHGHRRVHRCCSSSRPRSGGSARSRRRHINGIKDKSGSAVRV